MHYLPKSHNDLVEFIQELRKFNENIEIEKVFLKIENGFPINCNVNIIFLDNNQNVIDTLFKNQQIISGVSEDNLVIEKSISLLESENVNLEKIETYDSKNIFIDSKKIPLSRNKKVDLESALTLKSI